MKRQIVNQIEMERNRNRKEAIYCWSATTMNTYTYIGDTQPKDFCFVKTWTQGENDDKNLLMENTKKKNKKNKYFWINDQRSDWYRTKLIVQFLLLFAFFSHALNVSIQKTVENSNGA